MRKKERERERKGQSRRKGKGRFHVPFNALILLCLNRKKNILMGYISIKITIKTTEI
jgi:hypothetical protein